MSTYSFEEPIGFHLVKVKGAVQTGADAYRAVLTHNGLGACATLEEIHIYGHELKLDRSENYVYFTTDDTDSFLRLSWLEAITPETIGEQTTAKFKFYDGRWNDHHDSFSRPVTILR